MTDYRKQAIENVAKELGWHPDNTECDLWASSSDYGKYAQAAVQREEKLLAIRATLVANRNANEDIGKRFWTEPYDPT